MTAARRALICEDDPSIRSLVKTVVTREGFQVDVAPDGRVGLEKLRDNCYDLLVLDLMMPDVDGYQVVKLLRDDRPTMLKRIIIMTAATSAISRGDFPEPVCTLLPKPFDINHLKAAVRQCATECGTGT
jgi:DNA-binding response OmpR family regulator